MTPGLGRSKAPPWHASPNAFRSGSKLFLTTTHFHPEHAAGDAGFPDDTIILRNRRQQDELERDGQGMIEQFKGFNKEWAKMLEGAKFRPVDIIYDDKLKLDLGGVTVGLFWFGVGHTEGDQLILAEAPGESVLISGDIVQNKVVPSVPAAGGSLENWIRLLDDIERLHPQTVIPTHSRVASGDIVAEDREFIVDMRNRALSMKSNGVAVDKASDRLTEEFKRDYPEWAANADWNNVGAIPGFVRRVYMEADQ